MKRLLIVVSVIALAPAALHASGYRAGGVFNHVHNRNLSQCGPAAGPVIWADANHARQQFQRCLLKAHVWRVVTRTLAPAAQPTATTRPTISPSPTATPRPTATPIPWPTAAPSPTHPDCAADYDSCLLLSEINAERASHGYRPLALSASMSSGTGSCMGADGHARSMAQQGTIGHWDFPGDVCGFPATFHAANENVGVGAGGSEEADINMVQQGMIAEPWAPGCSGNHHCTEDDPGLTTIGIGIVAGAYQGIPAYYVSEEYGG